MKNKARIFAQGVSLSIHSYGFSFRHIQRDSQQNDEQQNIRKKSIFPFIKAQRFLSLFLFLLMILLPRLEIVVECIHPVSLCSYDVVSMAF